MCNQDEVCEAEIYNKTLKIEALILLQWQLIAYFVYYARLYDFQNVPPLLKWFSLTVECSFFSLYPMNDVSKCINISIHLIYFFHFVVIDVFVVLIRIWLFRIVQCINWITIYASNRYYFFLFKSQMPWMHPNAKKFLFVFSLWESLHLSHKHESLLVFQLYLLAPNISLTLCTIYVFLSRLLIHQIAWNQKEKTLIVHCFINCISFLHSLVIGFCLRCVFFYLFRAYTRWNSHNFSYFGRLKKKLANFMHNNISSLYIVEFIYHRSHSGDALFVVFSFILYVPYSRMRNATQHFSVHFMVYCFFTEYTLVQFKTVFFSLSRRNICK